MLLNLSGFKDSFEEFEFILKIPANFINLTIFLYTERILRFEEILEVKYFLERHVVRDKETKLLHRIICAVKKSEEEKRRIVISSLIA